LFGQELIHNLLAIVEARPFEPVKGLHQIQKIVPGGHAEDGQSSRHSESSPACCSRATTIIHEEAIGVNLNRQGNRGLFAGVELRQRNIVRLIRRKYVEPNWRMCNLVPHHQRRLRLC
jgi:hypothetical protein